MYVDYRQLNADDNFWKTEKEITKFAYQHIKELKRLKPFDFFKLAPQTYDVRGDGQDQDAGGGAKGKKADGGGGPPKAAAPFSAQKAVAAAGDDNAIPMAPTSENKQQNSMEMALNAINAELGANSVNMNRGPESDISQQKEVEQLMSSLSKHHINISNKTLQRALVLPKESQE